MLRFYEKEYGCSGICDVPLFYLTKPTSQGPPSEDCTEAVIKSFTDNPEIMIISALGTLAFWMAFLCSLPNCCGSKSEEN